MANNYNCSFVINGSTSLESVTVGGVLYSITPVVLNPSTPGLTTSIQNTLNGLGLGFFFYVNIGLGNTFHIGTRCTNSVLNLVTCSDGNKTVTNSGCQADFSCGLTGNPLADVDGTLTIDCTNLIGITFTDTTGDYSLSNTGGYGNPNQPARTDIISTTFNLWDAAGTTLLGVFDSPYIPSADGLGSILLTGANFGLTFAPGTAYKLQYQINLQGNICNLVVGPFTFPCCGGALNTGLATNFSVEETLGAVSIIFTDTTGSYNVSVNSGGYGAPNPDYSDITSTLIQITLSSGNVINITNFIPTADVPFIEISASMLGLPSAIPDQIIGIVYKVFTGDCVIGQKSDSAMLYLLTYNCIAQRLKNVLLPECCNDDKVWAAIKLKVQLDELLIAASGNINCVQGQIEALYQICSENCFTC